MDNIADIDPAHIDPTDVKYPELHFEMSGHDGNAFFIIGRARTLMRRSGIDNDAIEQFVTEATSGDYNHVLQTCMQYFDCT